MQPQRSQRTPRRKKSFLLLFSLCSLCPLWRSDQSSAQEPPKEPLEDVTQLTTGFSRAGEGYFSLDMKWIIFQAVPPGQEQYQMYVARLHITDGKSPAIDTPIRISPEKSRNTCGYFSPDGKSLIFASTAGKEKPDEPTGGYQRQGRSYVWSFPTGMEIFRFDDWQEAISNAKAGGIVDLAKHPLTNNDVYDAEGSFSPDGKYICFTRGGTKDADIYIMKSDGADQKTPIRITTAPGLASFNVAALSWYSRNASRRRSASAS